MEMADSGGYLILGLVVIFGLLGLFIASMSVRFRNIQKEKQLIEQLRDE